MTDGILVINAGSSSIKFQLYVSEGGGEPIVASKGQVEGIGSAPHFVAKGPDKTKLAEKRWEDGASATHEELLGHLIDWVGSHHTDVELKAAGHRVVHGGTKFSKPTLVDDEVIAELERLIPLAPLHNPHNITPIKALRAMYPDMPQVACFDTAFHRTMPKVSETYAIPRHLTEDENIRRYGFHGSSFEYIARAMKTEAPEIADGRIVVAHLGSGASMCGIKEGKSQATTMGLTALDGLVMGTRPGNLDPGVILYLLQKKNLTVTELENLLYKESGILGISEVSNDFLVIENSDDPRCIEAMDMVVYRIIKQTGAIAAALEGIDALVFTAGVGEHSPIIRGRVCKAVEWMGVKLDEEANEKNAKVISTADSKVKVLVIPTDEELMIALHTREVLAA